MAKSLFHWTVSVGIALKNRSISSSVKKVTSRSGAFMSSITVGSRLQTHSFFRYLNHDRIVIMWALTVLMVSPESERVMRQRSMSSLVMSSIRGSGISRAISKRKDHGEFSSFGRTSLGLRERTRGFLVMKPINRKIWKAYCSWVFLERPLWSLR